MAYGGRDDCQPGRRRPPAEAMPAWMKLTAYDRAKVLKKTADLMRERADAIARTLTHGAGQAAGRGQGRGAALGRHLRVVRRGGQARLRPGHPELDTRQAAPDDQAPRRRRRGHQPVELPDHAPGPQDRPGPRGRLHHRLQAGQPDAAVPDRGLRVPDRGRAAAGASPTSSSARRRRSADEFLENPAVRKISFTGSTEVGKQLDAAGRRPGEAAEPGTRRPRPVHRLPRRRPGGRWPRSPSWASSATTARCASPRAGSTSTRTSRRSSPRRPSRSPRR